MGFVKCTLLLSLFGQLGSGAKTDIKLGILVPWFHSSWDEGPRALSAAVIAINEINANNSVLPNYNLNYEWRDDGCSVKDALSNITDLWTNNVDGFIGPSCSESCETTGHLATFWNLPMISWSCASPALSDKKVYPTFGRTAGPYKTLGKPFAELMKAYKWYKCAIISANQNLYSQSARHIQTALEKEKASTNPEDCKPGSDDCQIQVVLYKQFFSGSNAGTNSSLQREREELLEEIRDTARIIFILGYTDDVRDFMLRAQEAEMLDGYVWIGVDILGHEAIGFMSEDTGRNVLAREAFQGLISYTVAVPTSQVYSTFEEDAIELMTSEFKYTPNKLSSYAQNLYDAVYLYAYSIDKLLADTPNAEIRDGKALAKYMMPTTFESLGRQVIINAEGDRESDYEITSYKNGKFIPIGAYTSATEQLVITGDNWVWPGNRPLSNVPHTCGSDTSICIDPEHNSPDKIVIAVIAVLLVLVIIGVAIFIWRRHEQAERDKKLWIIPREEIRVVGTKYRSSLSIGGEDEVDSRKSQFSLYSHHGMDTSHSGSTKAIYKGQIVGIQQLQKSTITITPSIIKEFKTVRELSHENINPIYGACPEPSNIIIVSGVMGKGTLQDILCDDKITLDDMFKSSMIGDAAKALEYLHKSVLQYHGNLTSNALGVDSHWVLKISDYGLREFRSGCVDTAENEDHMFTNKFWRAPELIKASVDKGTQKGDIYSFAVIINEILTRQFPYEAYNDSPKVIVEQIAKCSSPPFRPDLEPTSSNQVKRLQELIVEMWKNDPQQRPDSIGIIRRRLKTIYPEKSRSITERVILMMEKYAANLEIKVEERTAELQKEKQKADQLLYRMLPKQIAEKLKQGADISAQLFDNVTVYFSDVVSFTNLCAGSTPMEVVAFLDDMYTMFDSIIEPFDVYKVETIGDAYMLVSGLPDRNGDSHVVEITETALALIEGTSTFKVRHKPQYQLQIRVGIHSGPCCAGVVGKTMPRYCLFGDTINTASRMESNGQPMKVHMSETTFELLEPLDYYKLVERGGTIAVKGKGDMKTYFCEGAVPGKTKPKLAKDEDTPGSIKRQISAPAVRQPPRGYKSLGKSSPNDSVNSSPGLDSRNGPSQPLLKNGNSDVLQQLDALNDSAV